MKNILNPWDRFFTKIQGKKEAIQSQCIFRHLWGKWETQDQGDLKENGRIIGRFYIRKQLCWRCNEVRLKTWKVNVVDGKIETS